MRVMSDSPNPEQTIPPKGDYKKAEKYIGQLINLLDHDQLEVKHTNLAKYDPSTLHDHYCLDMSQYMIEVSHSKDPNSGRDSYVIIFNNLKHVSDGYSEKVLLAYMHLETNQFIRFKSAAESQLDRKKRAEEDKRLNEVMAPVDQALAKKSSFGDPQTNGIDYQFPASKTLSDFN